MKGISVEEVLEIIIQLNDELATAPGDEYYYLTMTTDGEDLSIGLMSHYDIFSTTEDDRKIIPEGDYEDFEPFLRRKINEFVYSISQIRKL